ncbi:phage tail assembly chaperone [uncultured Megasphaera sp.]|uniref:phage tail assembly chaperone n=1 Tax=uncultured Megasphaera sp. TaxID=165188 RepID=UPI0020599171|nr:hypothetical protein [uncultured Megasphaera sp.]DAQ39025.1 MAG TPA: tail assembly chaperone [Caudoviricetes sp.]
MAVSVQDLIKQKETIIAKKKELFDLTTSIGVITVQKPTRSFVADAIDLKDNDAYIVYEMTQTPNLKDAKLQEAYGCREPTDIVAKLFDAGEVIAISKQILANAGYGKEIEAKVHEDVKN